MEYFWSNTIWFILLGITTIIEFAYVLVKAEKRKPMLALYLTISGMVYSFQLTIFGFLKSYDYYPMIFNHISRLDDGLAGNIFSQFSVSATALLISFLNLNFYWYLLIALIYGGIEEIFLHLGIFKHYWYQTWMTVAGLIILFSITKLLYNKVFRRPGPILKYILTFFAVYVPHTILITWPFKLLGYPAFNKNVLPDPVTSVMLMFAISFLSLSNIIMIAYLFRFRWWWNMIIIALFYIAYYIAYKLNFIIYKNIGILIFFATAEILGMYLSVFIIDRLYDQGRR